MNAQHPAWHAIAADWLSFAAAPTFARMALLTGAVGGRPEIFCTAATSPLRGMVVMYGLMSAFHAAPWLRALASSLGRRQASAG